MRTLTEVNMSKTSTEIATIKLDPKEQPEIFVSVFSMIPRRKFTGDSPTPFHRSLPSQEISSVATSNCLNDKHSTYSLNQFPDVGKNSIVKKSTGDINNKASRVPPSQRPTSMGLAHRDQVNSQKTTFNYLDRKSSTNPKNQLHDRNKNGVAEKGASYLTNNTIRVPPFQQATSTLFDEQSYSQKMPFPRGEYHLGIEPNNDDCHEERESVQSIISRLESISKPTDCKPKSTVGQRDLSLKQKLNKNTNKVRSICASQRDQYHKEDKDTANLVEGGLKSAMIKSKSNSEDSFKVNGSRSLYLGNNDDVSTRRKNDMKIQSVKPRFPCSNQSVLGPKANNKHYRSIEGTNHTEITEGYDTNNNAFNMAKGVNIKQNGNIKKAGKEFYSHVGPPSSPEDKTIDAKRKENLTAIEKEPEKSVSNLELVSTPEARSESENQIQNDSNSKDSMALFNGAKDSNQKLIKSLSTLLDNQYLSQSFASFRNRRKHWFQNDKYSGHHNNSNVLEGDHSNQIDKEANDMDIFLDNPSLNRAFNVFRIRRRNSDLNSTNKCNILH